MPNRVAGVRCRADAVIVVTAAILSLRCVLKLPEFDERRHDESKHRRTHKHKCLCVSACVNSTQTCPNRQKLLAAQLRTVAVDGEICFFGCRWAFPCRSHVDQAILDLLDGKVHDRQPNTTQV